MGAVYLARHRNTGNPAAVKLMLPKMAADERAVEMFQREIRNTQAAEPSQCGALLVELVPLENITTGERLQMRAQGVDEEFVYYKNNLPRFVIVSGG